MCVCQLFATAKFCGKSFYICGNRFERQVNVLACLDFITTLCVLFSFNFSWANKQQSGETAKVEKWLRKKHVSPERETMALQTNWKTLAATTWFSFLCFLLMPKRENKTFFCSICSSCFQPHLKQSDTNGSKLKWNLYLCKYFAGTSEQKFVLWRVRRWWLEPLNDVSKIDAIENNSPVYRSQ